MVGSTYPFGRPPHDVDSLSQFDANGATGGCQAIYTVYPSSQTTGCEDLPLPAQTLDVQGVVDNGPISRFGWIDQVKRSGTPRPPHNRLTCIPVYRRFPNPQEWHTAVHYAYLPLSPSSVQDHVL